MISLYEYDSNKRGKKDYIDNMCHEFRTPLQIICGISENGLEYDNLKNETSRYYKDMTIINRNCEILLNKVESFIQEIKNLSEFDQSSVNHSDIYKKPAERCRGCYILNKWISDKKATNNQLLCSK